MTENAKLPNTPPPPPKPEKHFSGIRKCGHCGNSAPMELVKQAPFFVSEEIDHGSFKQLCWEEGWCYEILKCPACLDANIWRYHYHSEVPENNEAEHLFPVAGQIPTGLPGDIASEYTTALKVKSIDPNLYGVQLRRILELATHERGATGNTLHERLEDLAKKGEIPTRLADLASRLRQLGNIGAHAHPSQKLTPNETPILEKICLAVLEYVYSAPHLLDQAETRVEALKASQNK